MEPGNDKWINDVLGSLDGLNRSEPSPFLFAKIRHKLTERPSAGYVPARLVWLATASFALLAVLNWQLLQRESVNTDSGNTELNSVVNAMHLYPTTPQPYDVWTGRNY